MMATDLMTPGAGGRQQDASVGGTFDGRSQTKIDSKVVDHYNEELRELVTVAVEPALNYFLSYARSRLSPPWVNAMKKMGKVC